MDYGGRFIAIAKDFQKKGSITLEDGTTFKLPIKDVDPDKVTYKQVRSTNRTKRYY